MDGGAGLMELTQPTALQRPNRPRYKSDNGNIFFYKLTGRFEIVEFDVVTSGLKKISTEGSCKPFAKSNVF